MTAGDGARTRRDAREARRAALRREGETPEQDELPREAPPRPDPPPRERRERRPREGLRSGPLADAVRRAREHLRELQGADAETVSSFERTADGCVVTLEVVELRRIPDTTDVLASYRLELDGDGDLLACRRVRRYHRSEALDGGGP